MNKISVIIPSYNLEKKVQEVIERCPADYEVIVVDDGSSDMTGDVARKAGATVFTHKKNKGKGSAMMTGAKGAKGDIIVFIDGDMQHDPLALPRLVDPIINDKYDVVIGARRIKIGRKMPFHRWMSNSITSGLIRLTSRIRVHDSQSGFRATKKDCFLRLNLKSTRYEIETEWLVKAAKDKQRIGEVTIATIYNDSESHFSFKDIFNFLRIIITRRR